VLDDECGRLRRYDPALHDLSSKHSLLRIEISRRLINEINIALLGEAKSNGDTLQLTTRQGLHLVVIQILNIERNENLSLKDR